MTIQSFGLTALIMTITANICFAAETPIGQAIEKNGMEIGAVYLQPVIMDPPMPGNNLPADIHLEADIHAVKNNPNGFALGDWIPFLQVSYHLSKEGSLWTETGSLFPMVANDGPHYGANVKLAGPGKYHLVFHINPPAYAGFLRHADKETGVSQWWDPLDVNFDFPYFGTGKKGGY